MSSMKTWAATALILGMSAGSAAATDYNPGKDTANIRHKEMLEVRLPAGLCEFQNELPMNLVTVLETRRDLPELVGYMLENCPELALFLADTATASIALPELGQDSDDEGSGSAGGSTPGGTGGSGDGPAGDDDDGDNGHGNDADGHDESNPGNGKR